MVVLAEMPPPILAGCISVAAACSEAAISVSLSVTTPHKVYGKKGLIGANFGGIGVS